MQHATIAEVLDETIPREPGRYLYLVRDGETVFYIGKSFTVYDRLETHLGMDERKRESVLGRCVSNNLPESRQWAVELYSLEDCEEITLTHMAALGATWYSREVYYRSVDGAVTLAEQAMIAVHHPCLNTTYNTQPRPLPEKYQHIGTSSQFLKV